MHYDRFLARLKKLPSDEAKAFEERCIADGWILENRQGWKKKSDPDPFDAIVAEIKEEFRTDLAPHIAAEKKRQAQDEAIEEAKTAKKRSTKRKAE